MNDGNVLSVKTGADFLCSAIEDERKTYAAELLRLWEAGQLFMACQEVRNGKLTFDLGKSRDSRPAE
jgi:hypothetical protein